MIQRATDSYLLRLTMKAEEGGFWHLHHRGIEPPTVPELAAKGFLTEMILLPVVNDGRWVVRCPRQRCNGAQLASPRWTRFLCVDCNNVEFGGQWLTVEWPDDELVEAGEAALMARPDPATRNWDPSGETIGALLVENVEFGGLFDPVTGAVAGNIGADQQSYMIPDGTRFPSLPRAT